MYRERSPPLEFAPRAPSPDHLDPFTWFLPDAQRGEHTSKPTGAFNSKPIGAFTLPTDAVVRATRAAITPFRPAFPLLKAMAQTVFIPLPVKDIGTGTTTAVEPIPAEIVAECASKLVVAVFTLSTDAGVRATRAAITHLRSAGPHLKTMALSAFLPLPEKIGSAAVELIQVEIVTATAIAGASALSHLNPYLPPGVAELKNRFGRLGRSPLALSLPLTAADLDLNREIEPMSRHDWLTLYLSTLALLIWGAVVFSALDKGLITEVWKQGINWRVLPNAITDPVRTWAVVDDVAGIGGVCTGGVCQWTPLL
ncbi:hypothetical protein CspeluHIS016_0107370 [Cutaneotrichosporon spelunceum]|uniref:Uncharacterized protein n=1 Tax=Cutaneotrichosporon spelunceum TaxID=1672016 RepID=A0AAD3TPJ3_9TREE|nr:hypothetical protein CspeluHIS016_0107370 [Cutaneotrichosporon spelunceum]